jgi:serine/threonine protein phosphatase PrpC
MVAALRWSALSSSVRGASHEKNGLPNQDAVRSRNPGTGHEMLLMAIADGHGSTRSFRSDRGSALASECALRVMAKFVRRLGPDAPLSRVRNQARTRLPKDLIAAWKAAVRADLAKNPFTFMEFAAYPEKPPKIKPGEDLPITAYLAYGATLIALAITSRYVIYSQLGDGDILTVNDAGDVTRPLPRKHEYMSNQTVSVCSHNAHNEFQVRVDAMRGAVPALIMLSTDGYANCFGDDEAFFKVGADFLGYLREEGPSFVRDKLADWLQQSSRDGSGDDITVGLAAHDTVVPTKRRK